ncbi:MAG: MBL fold metallo-hydrolase [Bacteroidia bacterium]
MIQIHRFTFNPFQENTYLVADAAGTCAIIDPGCYTAAEQQQLTDYIAARGWRVAVLLNTHGHIDHMLGNRFVKDTYQVPFLTHRGVIAELQAASTYGLMMGIRATPSPEPDKLIDEGDQVAVGSLALHVHFTPGHSAGHISFLDSSSGSLFSGDVLFHDSIGRTDLPGGSLPQLMDTIRDQFMTLDDAVRIYPGHGPDTTIGRERRHNPFILGYLDRR